MNEMWKSRYIADIADLLRKNFELYAQVERKS